MLKLTAAATEDERGAFWDPRVGRFIQKRYRRCNRRDICSRVMGGVSRGVGRRKELRATSKSGRKGFVLAVRWLYFSAVTRCGACAVDNARVRSHSLLTNRRLLHASQPPASTWRQRWRRRIADEMFGRCVDGWQTCHHLPTNRGGHTRVLFRPSSLSTRVWRIQVSAKTLSFLPSFLTHARACDFVSGTRTDDW